jgi:hypothetical protein
MPFSARGRTTIERLGWIERCVFGSRSWRANGQRASVHRSECGHCNGGVGQGGGTRPDNGQWLGPTVTLVDAHRRVWDRPGEGGIA